MKIIKTFFKENSFSKIINLNKKIFKKNKVKKNNILIEFNNFCANHIPLSYCSNILSKKHDANIIGYYSNPLLVGGIDKGILHKIKILLGSLFNWRFFGVYKSFGTSKFIYPTRLISNNYQVKKNFDKFLKKVKNRKQLEKFKIDNILVGDLIYDTYLKSRYDLKPTIDLKSKNFQNFVNDFICIYFFWKEYIDTNNVKVVIGSHATYILALPLRIASNSNIDAFVLSPENLFRLNKKFLHQYYEVNYFKKLFKKINHKQQKNLINKAKERMNKRTLGKYSSDYPYVTISPFAKIKKLTKNSLFYNSKKKLKFVIATHDFVDACHAMGFSIFPDFYQWARHLCKLSENEDIQWFIKTHPKFGGDYSPYIKHERSVAIELTKEFKNVRILNQNITLNELAKNKVDAIFTVNGTIGMDCAEINLPVINSSNNNPHINYSFNIHPKNLKELENVIFNFDRIRKNFKINKNEIYEYYAMKNIFFSKNWFFDSYEDVLLELKSYHNLGKPIFYDYWLNKYPNTNVKVDKIEKYFYSKNLFCLNNNNIGVF